MKKGEYSHFFVEIIIIKTFVFSFLHFFPSSLWFLFLWRYMLYRQASKQASSVL